AELEWSGVRRIAGNGDAEHAGLCGFDVVAKSASVVVRRLPGGAGDVALTANSAAADRTLRLALDQLPAGKQRLLNLPCHGRRGQRLEPLPMRVEALELRGHGPSLPNLSPPDHAPPTSSCSAV